MDREDYNLYTGLFKGLEGLFKKRNGGVLEEVELTPQRLEEQVAGSQSYGIYLRRKDGRVGLAMFDIDVINGKLPHPELYQKISRLHPIVEGLLKAAQQLGLQKEHTLLEFCGVGYHLWFFFEEPIPATEAARFLGALQQKAGVRPLAYKPQPGELPEGSLGESAWLPLRFNDTSKLNSVFLNKWSPSDDPAKVSNVADFSPLKRVRRIPVKLVQQISANCN